MEWAVQTGATAEVLRELAARLRRRRQIRTAGITIAAVLCAGWGWQRWWPLNDDASVNRPESIAVGAPEHRALPDGSRVDLKPGAAIHVVFSSATRRVVLERGEAHFQVAKNVHRPFVVQAGAVEARAVGTAFSVQLTSGATEVIVTEGLVAIDRPTAPGIAPSPAVLKAGAVPADSATTATLAVLRPGHRVVVETSSPSPNPIPRVEQLSATALNERLAWRVPTLEFSGTPLAEAIAMFNRHGNVRLVLADRSIGTVRLSGVIRADNIDTLLRLLKDEHGIAAERRPEGELMLSQAR